MRRSARGNSDDQGGWGGQLISLSDLMAGLLFVFILIVLVFAFELNRATQAHKKVIDDYSNTQMIREGMLNMIRDKLIEAGITKVEINPETGVLSLPEDILFPSGSTELRQEGLDNLAILARVMSEVLPCYSGKSEDAAPSDCEGGAHRGRLEAVFIEGHTDDVPVSAASRFRDNWDLSTARAIAVFNVLTTQRPDLDKLTSASSQLLFSVSGYADRRPHRKSSSTSPVDGDRALNRRIDVRFIMAYPRNPDAAAEPPDVVTETDERLQAASRN